jgi:hypothetical protein
MAPCLHVRYSSSINNALTKENIMKVRKNFEAVFLATATIACLMGYATASVPTAAAVAAAPKVVTVTYKEMQVVEVKHKRLSAEEKAQLN